MSSIELNGVTVYASAVESVEDGVSYEYDKLYQKAANALFFQAWATTDLASLEELEQAAREIEFPSVKDHPAVIVRLTSGREFRIVGKTRKEVEIDIFWAMKGYGYER